MVEMSGVGGYAKIGNEFTHQLYTNYTKNIEVVTVSNAWDGKDCAHPQFQSMFHELMNNRLDKIDLIYTLWTPEIIVKPEYDSPVVLETMFETTSIKDSWVDKCNIASEVWNPSKWGTNVFKSCGVKNVKHVPFGMDFSTDGESIPQLDADDRFKFLFINQYSVRKNARMTIQAFLETFSARDNVVLYIRADVLPQLESVGFDQFTIARDLHELKMENPDSPQVILLDRFTDAILHKLYNSVDILLAPSSGEGFGKTVAEAASHGVPAIITNWSATSEFIDNKSGFLLGYELDYINLSTVEMETYFMVENMQWAIPDYLQLCEYMLYAFEHLDETVQLGKQAEKNVKKQFGWDKCLPPRIKAMEALI